MWISANGVLIDRSLTESWYPYSYGIAFLLGAYILWTEGRKRDVSMAAWMLLMSSAVFMIILGTRLGTFDFAEWRHWWSEGTPLWQGRKTAVGGLLFGFLGLWAVRAMLDYRGSLWDAFAVYLPFTLILHRTGCLFAGCCSGLPSDMPWAIRYLGPGWLRDIHVHLGHVPAEAMASAPVHPVPVYEMLCSLGIMALLFAIRKRALPGGLRILLSVGLLLTARFFLEFLREPMGNFAMADTTLGLKTVQWICLVLLALVGMRAIWIMRAGQSVPLTVPMHLGHRHWLLLIVMLALVLKGDRFFTGLERLVLLAHLLPTLTLMLRTSLQPGQSGWSMPFLRIALPSVAVLLFAGMEGDPVREGYPESQRRTTFYLQGSKPGLPGPRYPCLTPGEHGCLGTYCAERDLQRPLGPRYRVFQGGVEHFEKLPFRSYSWVFGADGQVEQYSNDTSDFRMGMGNVHLYGGLEGDQFVGFRLGVRTGTLFQDSDSDIKSFSPFIFMSSRFWMGYYPWAVVQLGYYDPVVAGMSATSAYALINANAGQLSPRWLGRTRFGLANMSGFGTNLYFWDLDVRLGRHWVLAPSVTRLKGKGHEQGNTWGFGLGMKYTVFKPS